MRNGRAPHAGERFCFPEQASTLEEIAATKGESFYRGALAETISSFASGAGLTADDLGAHQPEWVEPASQPYRGFRVHEIPPNGQGLAALIALGVLEHTDLASHDPDSPASLHLQIEAMKLAFADVYRHVSDPDTMEVRWQDLVEPSYLKARARQIDATRARRPVPGLSPSGTVYLTAADAGGMMVSFIQSNYMGFGSGVVVPGTGISLQNRGAGFTLEQGHPNEVGPRKRPFHTIIPAFMTRDGRPVMSFGVMGGDMQPQGHVQMVTRVVDYRQNPQAAADAPRWKIALDGSLLLEAAVKRDTADRTITSRARGTDRGDRQSRVRCRATRLQARGRVSGGVGTPTRRAGRGLLNPGLTRTRLCWCRWQRRFLLESADPRAEGSPDGLNTGELWSKFSTRFCRFAGSRGRTRCRDRLESSARVSS